MNWTLVEVMKSYKKHLDAYGESILALWELAKKQDKEIKELQKFKKEFE